MKRLAHWLLGHAPLVAAFLATIVVAAAILAPRLRSEAGLSIYIDPEHRLAKASRVVAGHFVGDEIIFVTYTTDDIFAQRRLQTLRDVGDAIEAIEVDGEMLIGDVRSLATIDDLVGEDDGFRTQPLVPDPIPDDTSRIAARAANNPIVRDQLLADSARVGAFVVRLRDGLTDEQQGAAIDAIHKVLAGHDDLHWPLAGEPVVKSNMARLQQADVARFIPWVYLTLAVLVVFFVRRILGVLIALASVGVSILTGFAMLVVTGSSLNNTSAMLAPAIMSLTVALFVHFFNEYAHSEGSPTEILADVLPPIAVAELTTVLGFFGLATASVPAVREFGVAAGLAVVVSFVATTCILVLVCRYVTPSRLASTSGIVNSTRLASALATYSLWVIRHHRPILVGTVVSVFLAVVGALKIHVDQDVITFFPESAEVRAATGVVDAELGGSTVVIAAVDGGRAGRFTEPAAMQKLERLTQRLGELGAVRTIGPHDYVALMRRELMGGAASELHLPDTAEQIAQLLLLNGDTSLDEHLDGERRWARVMARFPKHSARDVTDLYAALDASLADIFPENDGWSTIAVSGARQQASLANELIGDQAGSLIWSGVPIVLIMILMLRSIKLGAFSLLPNVYPIFMSFGAMGWLGIELNIATVMTATVALGIVVDDTVHFLRSLAVELRKYDDLPRAVAETMRAKGIGMLGTALVIQLAFGVLLFSDFGPTRAFGLLMCIVMSTALVGDLVIMPAALVAFGSKRLALRGAQPRMKEEFA